ncbi:MAG: insulinase family protein [Bacteroidetes bacterium]|nr:insulinase family protein [Bacteroidota bacterium]
MNLRRLLLAGVTLVAGLTGSTQSIPLDPAVRTGRLANGFTYYIRHNPTPARQVQLYLVCKVGSILEDEDQRGLAHFMEHMNFNGTKHFPKNELVDYLQKAGVRFGADLNAYTSFDETVYQLPLPTGNAALLTGGLQIMRDWAQEATLDSVELEKERGIVLEEERLGKGARDRITRGYLPVLLNQSRYADRLPIGTDSVLLHFRPAVIRRFHQDWYRPDLQALIVVGDVDVDAIEKAVKEKFSDLKNPAAERPRTAYTVPLTGGRQFIVVTDKEDDATALKVLIKHKTSPLVTESDYRESMKKALFNSMVSARRYAELSQDKNPAYVNVSVGIESLMGGADMFAFEVTAKQGQLQAAFDRSWEVVEKIRRNGFVLSELDRAKKNYLRGLENAVAEKDKTPSVSFVKEYQRLFLGKEASPGIEWEYKFVKDNLGSISLEDIRSLTAEYLKETDRDIIITAPEKDKAGLPGEATVAGWFKDVGSKNLVAYKDETVDRPLMTSKPVAGKVTKRESFAPIGVTQLTLSNGLRVVLKPTDFKNDEITFKAYASGGTSVYDDADYDAAASASQVIASFGLGDLNPVQLNTVLNGRSVRVAPYISARTEGVTGTSSVSDFETALQLVHLYFTQPRKDQVLFENIIGKSKAVLPNRYADPGNVFNDTMAYVNGNYKYRYSPPTLEKLEKITLEKTYRIYKERFADASGFTFVFVGNFRPDSIAPLLETYLGSLPSLHKNEQARDLGVHVPEGQLIKNVYKGKEDKALVRLMFTGDAPYNKLNNQKLHALSQVLQIKMLQQLREQESEVYSPSVQPIFNKYPKSRYGLVIAFGCAPANVDHLVALVQQEMADLRLKGPDEVDVEKYKAGIKKNTELALKDNGFWLGYLDGQYENGEDLLEVLHTDEVLDSITVGSLKEAAGRFLDGKNQIRFALLPESEAPVAESNFFKREAFARGGDTLIFINKSQDFDTALGRRIVDVFFKVYPEEVKRFNPKAPKTVTFVIDPAYRGVAATGNDSVRFDPGYIKKAPGDIDVVTHEAMHVVQAYPAGGPGWITEGIADYVRYKYGVDNAGAKWRLPLFNMDQSYMDGYKVTARFFVWLEKEIDPAIVNKLDALMRSGKYEAGAWKKWTGRTLDQLWQSYTDKLGI